MKIEPGKMVVSQVLCIASQQIAIGVLEKTASGRNMFTYLKRNVFWIVHVCILSSTDAQSLAKYKQSS